MEGSLRISVVEREQLSFAFIRLSYYLSLLPNETNFNGSLILKMDFCGCYVIQDATGAIRNDEEVTSATSNIDVTGSISSE